MSREKQAQMTSPISSVWHCVSIFPHVSESVVGKHQQVSGLRALGSPKEKSDAFEVTRAFISSRKRLSKEPFSIAMLQRNIAMDASQESVDCKIKQLVLDCSPVA